MLFGPDGQPIAAEVLAYIGPIADGEKALAPFRAFGPPVADMVAPTPYVQHQQLLDAGLPPGLNNYWTSNFIGTLTDEAIDIAVDGFAQAPTPLCVLVLEQLGGAVRRVPESESAFTLRQGDYNLAIVGRWTDPADAEKTIAWAKRPQQATGAALAGLDLRQLSARGRGRTRRVDLRRRALSAAAGSQEEVRPEQRVLPQREHRACGVNTGRRGTHDSAETAAISALM